MYQSDSAPWLWFRAWATDGSAKTDLVYNTSGISIKVARDNQADSSALSLSAASSPTDWAAGKFLQVVGNLYKVGIATASISSYTGAIAICGSYTGGTIEGVLDYVSAYNPAGNPNTMTPPTVGAIADQVWDEARSGHVTAGTFGEKVNAELDSATQTKINKIEASTCGTVTGAGTSTEVFVGPSATLTITVDASGNRSSVVVT